MTKSIVCRKTRMVHTPDVLVQRISEQLEREARGSSPESKHWWQRIRYVGPVLVIAVACVAAFFVLNPLRRSSTEAHPASNSSDNIITQSLANYQAMASGAILPQQLSGDPQHLSGFFAGKTDFPVLVPQLAGCTLVGGVLNQHSGTTLAHVVYMHNGNLVYMFEACWETVKRGEKLRLPQPVQDELLRKGLVAEAQPDGRTVVLWTKGNTLCAAVARMNKDDLIACLSAGGNDVREVW